MAPYNGLPYFSIATLLLFARWTVWFIRLLSQPKVMARNPTLKRYWQNYPLINL